MKKNIIISAVLSVITNILLPLAIVFLIGGLDAMGILLLLLFVLNPIVSIVIGILSGGKTVQWYLPVINAAVFFVAESILVGFDVSNVIAAVVYAALGLAATYITKAIKGKKADNAD